METSHESVIYCVYCGAKNVADGSFCKECGKDLHPQENLLKDYIIKETKDEAKSRISDTIAGMLRKFILAHLYGILLTVSVVFTAGSAIAAFAASDVPKDAVRLSQPPIANALGYLVSEEEAETAASDSYSEIFNETKSISESEAVHEAVTEPTVTEEPESIAESEVVEDAETSPAVTASEIYEAYLLLLPEAAGDTPGYYIYDIDKDGIPELLLTAENGPDRGLSVYSYENGSAYSAGIIWGFAHGSPIPASYPEGNGIVLTEVARSYECIWIISKEGNSMNDSVQTSENSVYTEPLYSDVSTYYQNAEEGLFSSVGHPYRADTTAPYFEGSRLLGFNSASDDSALKEALGI